MSVIIWTILTVVAAAALAAYGRGRNAVWGGLLIGAVGGLVVALIGMFRGGAMVWLTVLKGSVVGILLGVGADLLGRWSDRQRARD